ncbi:MAG TPA: CinA family protein [Microbacterium sp.]|nr:CinA family protein [Microbacterium sp.]
MEDAAPDSLATLAGLARHHEVRLAVAESLTSGLLASRVGAAEDAATWFAGGVVAYQRSSKEDVLGVPQGIDLCSAMCAEAMAEGVRSLFGVDLAVSTTGVGGPEAQGVHAAGSVYLGWAAPGETGHEFHRFDGEPTEVLEQTAAAAIALVCRLIEDRGRDRLRPAGAQRG